MLNSESNPLRTNIYDVIRQIPEGQVATYGQIAEIVGSCTPRMVGYALAALTRGSDVPWQRVINAQGKISPRANPDETEEQYHRLKDEGIVFDENRRVNLRVWRADSGQLRIDSG